MTIEEVWNKIQKHEGEIFSTKKGIKFSYLIKNERIYVSSLDSHTHIF